jgi:hypothetical protein
MVGAVQVEAVQVEAVKTATSTFGIWAIVVVAVVCLAVWLVGVSVADNIQTRASRRLRRLRATEPVSAIAGRAEAPTRPDLTAQAAPTEQALPAKRTGDARQE